VDQVDDSRHKQSLGDPAGAAVIQLYRALIRELQADPLKAMRLKPPGTRFYWLTVVLLVTDSRMQLS
jgi:hypothetical protein